MAAAAPKTRPDYLSSSAATVPVSPAVSSRAETSSARATARVQARPQRHVREEIIAPEVRQEALQRRARSRAKTHRPLRLTWTQALCGAAIMGQLVLLLWMHGRALSAARRVDELDAKIAVTVNKIQRAQEKIAAFDSAPRIEQWAHEMGWKPAGHLDFDDVTKTDLSEAISSAQKDAASTSDVQNGGDTR